MVWLLRKFVMNITPYFPSDLWVDDLCPEASLKYLADQQNLGIAEQLSYHLNGHEGQTLINRLRTEDKVIILCQVSRPGNWNIVRFVLSGNGLMTQGLKHDVVKSETPASCLFAYCACWAQGQIPRFMKLFSPDAYKLSTSSTAGEVDKPPT